MSTDSGTVTTEIRGRDLASVKAAPSRFEDLYRSHWGELCSYLKRLFGPGPPDPEDVAQAAFTKFASLDDPARVENARAFLYATARNIVMDHKRHESVVEKMVDDVLLAIGQESLSEMSPERVLIEKQRFAMLAAVVKRLPPKQRTVLVLSRFHGFTHEEIARQTGWSRPNVSKHVRDAVAAIKAEFDAADHLPDEPGKP